MIIDGLMTLIAGVSTIPVVVFGLQVFVARSSEQSIDNASRRRSCVAVLIPAHNEASIIANTLRTLMPQLDPDEDRLVVVADNCSDNTAILARECGATVIERRDSDKRGKGYALDFGVQFLARDNPPNIVIIIDADCQVSVGGIDTLAQNAMRTNRPVQGLYLMHAPADKSVNQAIAEFAWLVKNCVRPLGMKRLGLPCQLMGTGMAFPWDLLCKADLAHGNMVEDMKLGIDLALLGHPPVFCPSALVTSEFPVSGPATDNQRKRWEHGHLATIFAETPRLLKAAIKRRDTSLLAMALDLSVPPLSALGLSLIAMLSLSFFVALLGVDNAALALMAILVSLFTLAVLAAWFRFGKERLPLRVLLSFPAYMLRKIPLYLAFLVKRQQSWVKTERR